MGFYMVSSGYILLNEGPDTVRVICPFCETEFYIYKPLIDSYAELYHLVRFPCPKCTNIIICNPETISKQLE